MNIFDQKIRANSSYRMVRYADDILIFTKSKREAGNARAWAAKILEEEMKLTVNKEKTSPTSLKESVTFLRFILRRKSVGIDPKKIQRFKDKVRELTKQNPVNPIETVIGKLNCYLRGWINYYRVVNIIIFCRIEMAWIRRRLRMIRMKQWKTCKAMHKEL